MGSNSIESLDNDLILKFLSLIRPSSDGCWIYSGGSNGDYGWFSATKDKIRFRNYAHRISFSIFNGQLINGLVIDHKCMNKKCVNPEHIRQVTQAVNATENSKSFSAINKTKTHCPSGHEYSLDNIYKSNSWRNCKTCSKDRSKRQRSKGLV